MTHVAATRTSAAPEAAISAPPRELIDALKNVRRPLLAGHVTPDADCIGSCAGLARTLNDRGCQARVALPGGAVAKKLCFLLDLAGRDLFTEGRAEGHDALIVLDTAGPKRINAPVTLDSLGGAALLNIDHHLSNPGFGTVNWIDPAASSSSELVYRLVVALGATPSSDVASLLYAGIHGDTAGFSLSNVSAAALHASAELVRWGADVAGIGERLCRSQESPDFELLRRVYDHTKISSDGRIAWSHVGLNDLAESGCRADDIDDQVSVPRSLAGIRIALLFSEGEPGVVRINLRGEGEVSVLPLAQLYGGGGHAQSAGVRIKNRPLTAVIEEVVAAARKYLDSLG